MGNAQTQIDAVLCRSKDTQTHGASGPLRRSQQEAGADGHSGYATQQITAIRDRWPTTLCVGVCVCVCVCVCVWERERVGGDRDMDG